MSTQLPIPGAAAGAGQGPDPGFALRPEDVLAHQGALRALARRLVQDEGVADDVVQDAWLAALRGGPRRTGEGGLRSWLVTVLRNAARKEGRGTQRRADREAIAARPGPLPPTEEVAERAAMHREIVDRVLALDEPYRTVLLLRYFEDLPPRRIAERVDATVTTVNQQLLRGRQRLREALDTKYGRRADWRGFFLLALGREAPTAIGAASTGWLGSLPLQVAAGVFVLGGGIWLAERISEEPVLPLSEVTLLPPGMEGEPPGDSLGLSPGTRIPVDVPESLGREEIDVVGDLGSSEIGGDEATVKTSLNETGSVLASSRGSRREGPPGTVRMKGGSFKMGTSVAEAKRRIQGAPSMASAIAAEVPQHTVSVESFHLMTTEVTNEQYEAFVRATGAEPPLHWAGWECPPELLTLPVIHVDHDAATAYASWAGMRLPTEAEMQFAASRKSAGDWADDVWHDDLWSVASNPRAKTKEGVYDVVGNVWEWTSSPYVAYEDHGAALVVWGTDGSRIEAVPNFNPDMRVAYGGSHLSADTTETPTIRRGTVRTQATGALGFRCGVSQDRAFDQASRVLQETDVPLGLFVPFHPEPSALVERWTAEEGTARERSWRGKLREYAVITGYDRILFIPAQVMDPTPKGLIDRSARQGSVRVGCFETTVSLIQPSLPAGRYIVSFYAPGALPPGVDQYGRGLAGYRQGQAHLLYQDLEGEPVALGFAGEPWLESGRVQAGRCTLAENTDSPPYLELEISLPGPSKGRGIDLRVRLFAEGDTFRSGWIF